MKNLKKETCKGETVWLRPLPSVPRSPRGTRRLPRLCTPAAKIIQNSQLLKRLLLSVCHLWQGLVLLLVLNVAKFMMDRVQVLEAEEKVSKQVRSKTNINFN